jgi:hypothetical protein
LRLEEKSDTAGYQPDHPENEGEDKEHGEFRGYTARLQAEHQVYAC